ncbi:MAG TPA: c-type cytochrome biogenesis protein CcmI [Azospirillaceae bacterium]|nr:c-type cytochrome biogenesis protein CcmI [Azospirillaceae bacterium]
MLFWIAAAVMTLGTVAALVWPLLRPAAGAADRAEMAMRVYKDQVAEIERDLARGLIDADQAAASRTEIGRRLLAAAEEARRADKRIGGFRRSPVVAGALALCVPLGALALYLPLGRPELPAQPFASRTDKPDDSDHALTMVASLEQKLQRNPEDREGWRLLAGSYMQMGRPADAAEAYRRAMALSPDDPNLPGAFAEALTMAEDGMVNPEARQSFERVLAIRPEDPRARFYLGLADLQAGQPKLAVERWAALMKDSPADAPWVGPLREQMTDAAKQAGLDPAKVIPQPAAAAQVAEAAPAASPAAGPSSEDMAAAAQMAPEERQQMIRGMVDGLAARLKDNPNDPEGWQRLARAYGVLGESAKAEEAQRNAAKYAAQAASTQSGPPPANATGAAPAGNPPPLSKEQMEAAEAMSPDEQKEMIRGMVDRLAAKLQQNPGDTDGWLKLANAWEVMGDKSKALDALKRASASAPQRTDVQLAYARALVPEDGTRPPQAFFDVMRGILKREPENPQALWYLGLEASETGRKTEAKAMWTKLLAQLPPDSADRKDLQGRIDALR